VQSKRRVTKSNPSRLDITIIKNIKTKSKPNKAKPFYKDEKKAQQKSWAKKKGDRSLPRYY